MSLSDGNAWIQFYQGRAVYASVDIGLADAPLGNISVPAGTKLYAPTHLPRGGSCIEVVTVHEPGGQWPHWVGFWDWCSIADRGFWALPPQSLTGGSFVDKYVRAYTDEFGRTRKVYFVTIFADIASEVQPFTVDTWHAVLYNFNTGNYEQIYQSTGTANALFQLNPLGIGWSMWESFGVYHTCPRLRSLAVANLQIRVNGNWKVPDEPSSHLGADLNFLSCGYSLISPYSYAAWWSLTPVM